MTIINLILYCYSFLNVSKAKANTNYSATVIFIYVKNLLQIYKQIVLKKRVFKFISIILLSILFSLDVIELFIRLLILNKVFNIM